MEAGTLPSLVESALISFGKAAKRVRSGSTGVVPHTLRRLEPGKPAYDHIIHSQRAWGCGDREALPGGDDGDHDSSMPYPACGHPPQIPGRESKLQAVPSGFGEGRGRVAVRGEVHSGCREEKVMMMQACPTRPSATLPKSPVESQGCRLSCQDLGRDGVGLRCAVKFKADVERNER